MLKLYRMCESNVLRQHIRCEEEKQAIMANVRLAPVLRTAAGGSKQVIAQGSTLQEVLSDLYERYPGLQEQLQPEGGLSRFVNVYVNDQDVRYLQGLETNVGPNDTVILLPAMAGGC
jgi:molybdopterin synthase sulfur carrier subunit